MKNKLKDTLGVDMEPELRIGSDGFIWKIITKKQAWDCCYHNIFEVFILADDGGEFLLNGDEFDDDNDYTYAIEVGFLHKAEKEVKYDND